MQNLSDMITLTDEEKKLLKDNFEEKLKDKDFKELVSLLKVDKEKLYDHTSNLEEASVEFSNCKNCKGLESCKNKVKGYMYKPVITNDTGDVSLYVNESTGYLLSDNTSESLIKVFESLIQKSKEETRQMRMLARKKAEVSFDFRCYIELFEKFISSINKM